MSAVLLTHAHFQRPPVPMLKRPRRLPPGVVSIDSVRPLRVGVLAEIVTGRKVNVGIRVRITKYDYQSKWCFYCESLDRDIACNDGAAERGAWIRASSLRRVWTGNAAPAKAGVL